LAIIYNSPKAAMIIILFINISARKPIDAVGSMGGIAAP
jgi:hypothetical protein